ncbi:unnamed protein product [Lepeophtheirus salmonis]|uniref:(salmon louse) hypothetical protein n=1 Tax=Lepeophtheirus salmonis TaxID=72036 RepID=A0A7R8CP25_LEPSM|nr:unnamed protein product [Lepeophtheirus salmonis]CAF2881968.1 unnamed protein product [Lepeophtheirus salmonis]
MRKLRESEGLLSVKDKTITELRSRIPDTVDKLIAASTATGPSGFPLALSEDYESRQGLKIAQSTVECLRERLKQKEDILIRYELHIKSIRDESEKETLKFKFEGDDKNTFQLDLADKKIQDLEEEIGSLHRSIAETSDKLNHVLKDRDKYFALSEEFRRKLEELRDPSSSSEDISTLHRLNEEISHLQMELEHAHERENELLKKKKQHGVEN